MTPNAGQIHQNCMMMFPYTDVMAFIIRLSIFFMILSGYPVVHYFVSTMVEDLFFKDQKVSRISTVIIGIGLNASGFLCALFYPNVGSVLAYFGAVSGFLIIYTIPVIVHLK